MPTHAALLAAVVAGLLGRASAQGSDDGYRRLRGESLATPFAAELGEDERIAGLSLLWSEARFNFANFDLVPDLDWDAAYLAAIPEVRRAPDTLTYYRELQRLCARLQDGHTAVYLPKELQRSHARPPLRTAVVEGRVWIAECRSAQLRELGLQRGQEIVAVDGEPVLEYAERAFGPFVCASTPQDRTRRLLVQELLAGPAQQPVTVTVAVPGGDQRDVVVPRTGHDADPPPPKYAFTLLPDDVALVRIDTFNDPAVAEAFTADLPRLMSAAALVLDLRENGGGSSNVGYRVLAHLTETAFRGSLWSTAEYRPAYRAWNRPSPPLKGDPQLVQPAPGAHFTGPVAMLIGPGTFSAAEDCAVAFDAMQRGPLVGEPTGGSTGQPLFVPLPGGGRAIICTKRDRYPDGREFVGKGVQPTIAVTTTVADFVASRDPVLERAVAALRKDR